MNKLKLIVLGLSLVGVGCFFIFDPTPSSLAQTSNPASLNVPPSTERLDEIVQKRFLDTVGFGMARIATLPRKPEPLKSKHVMTFGPRNDQEQSVVDEFAGWDLGIYLFGRWAMEKEGDNNGKFKIDYRINQAIPVTPGLKPTDFPRPRKIIDEVKDAFYEFQAVSEADQKPIELSSRGDWTYIATPVRIANQSCIQCHTDYVATRRMENGQVAFRKKQIGDVNGILVYALRRSQP